MSLIERIWYGRTGLWPALLFPLSMLFAMLSGARRMAYRQGLLRQERFALPVVVVGNITVGGTGKTPLVLALLERLKAAGWKPGVVSRGYGGKADYPLLVGQDTAAGQAGDEPCLLARRSGCPVVVDPVRCQAVRHLMQHADVDVIISDDGMQHYALGRDLEVAVIDGLRRFGNGFLLPAGPLRESTRRLRCVDAVIVNEGREDEAAMHLRQEDAVSLGDGQRRRLDSFRGQRVHAVAGIGNPERFFSQLRAAGLQVQAHPFPDHHPYTAADLLFSDGSPVLMTEKDAVKCRRIAPADSWYVPVEAEFNALGNDALNHLIERLNALRKTHG